MNLNDLFEKRAFFNFTKSIILLIVYARYRSPTHCSLSLRRASIVAIFSSRDSESLAHWIKETHVPRNPRPIVETWEQKLARALSRLMLIRLGFTLDFDERCPSLPPRSFCLLLGTFRHAHLGFRSSGMSNRRLRRN